MHYGKNHDEQKTRRTKDTTGKTTILRFFLQNNLHENASHDNIFLRLRFTAMLFAKTRNKIKNEKVKMPSICIFFNITLTKSRNSSGLTLLSQMTDYFPGTIAKIHSEYNVIMEKYRVEYHDRIAAEFKESTCNPDVTDLSIRGYRDNRCRITNSSPALAILVLFADELIKNGFAKLNCQEMLIVHTATADCAPIALNALIRLVLKNRAVDGIKFEEDIFRKRATAYRDACSALYRNTMTNANANANTIEDGLFTYFYCALCAAILRTRLDGFTENLMHPLLDVEYPEDTVTKIHREYDIIMESYRVAYHDRIATEFKECMYDSNVTNLSVSGYCQNGCKIAHNSPVLAIITLLADKLFDHGFNDVSECRDMLIVYTVMANCAPIALEQTMREILKSGKISKKEINYRADSYHENATKIRSSYFKIYRDTWLPPHSIMYDFELFKYFYCALYIAIVRFRRDGSAENLMHPLLDVNMDDDASRDNTVNASCDNTENA